MRLEHTRALLTAFLLAGCFHGCEEPPPSLESDCWSHRLAQGDDLACATAAEHEPNGDLVAANTLEEGSCELRFVRGSVSGDIDVFRTRGKPCLKHSMPHATLKADQDDVRLCVFAACHAGKTGLSGCSGSVSLAGQSPVVQHMPEGIVGCCRAGSGDVTVEVHCDSEYATVGKGPEWQTYFVVDRVRDSECTSYEIGYQF
jgi:hypothetical protein